MNITKVPEVRLPAYREILAYNKVVPVLLAIWHPKRDKPDREKWRDSDNNDGDGPPVR